MNGRVSNPVTQLLGDSLGGKLSRRDILKRGTALGLSAPLMGVMLSAERVGAQASPSPEAAGEAGFSIVVPEGLRTDLAGQQISIMLDPDGPGLAFEEAMVARFNEATGIEVERVGAPQGEERLNQYLTLFANQAGDLDAMQYDVIHTGVVGPHALDLTEVMQSQGVEYFPSIVENNTFDGALVGIPFYTDAGLLYYRTDLLETYGFDGPPTTWDELQEMAQTIQEGEQANSEEFQGFVFQGANYEGLTCNSLEWQYSNGGGTIIDPDGTVTVANEQVVAMMQTAQGWIGTIAPQGVTTYDEELSRGVWAGGNAAFMRNWPYAYGLSQAPDAETGELPATANNFDVTGLPAGTGEGAQSAATLGGWQMMVSAYSEAPEAAMEFAKYTTSPELQKAFAIERSFLPTIADLYSDQDILAANPFFERLLPIFQGGAVARPATVVGDLYPQVSSAYSTAVNSILTGADPQSTIDSLAAQLESIVGAA